MPSITVSPRSIVNQIKNLLRDRYASGYPILKELVQNAYDAEARRVRLETLAGWPNADNPLLRGPGLLAVNDGTFRRENRIADLMHRMQSNPSSVRLPVAAMAYPRQLQLADKRAPPAARRRQPRSVLRSVTCVVPPSSPCR